MGAPDITIGTYGPCYCSTYRTSNELVLFSKPKSAKAKLESFFSYTNRAIMSLVSVPAPTETILAEFIARIVELTREQLSPTPVQIMWF